MHTINCFTYLTAGGADFKNPKDTAVVEFSNKSKTATTQSAIVFPDEDKDEAVIDRAISYYVNTHIEALRMALYVDGIGYIANTYKLDGDARLKKISEFISGSRIIY